MKVGELKAILSTIDEHVDVFYFENSEPVLVDSVEVERVVDEWPEEYNMPVGFQFVVLGDMWGPTR